MDAHSTHVQLMEQGGGAVTIEKLLRKRSLKRNPKIMNMLGLLTALLIWTGGDDTAEYAPIDKQHFLLYGFTVEMLYESGDEGNAPATLCKVFIGDEIYTAFRSNAKGEYVFNLPKGERYTLMFGGDDFVNKIVEIDARELVDSRKEAVIAMDMALFRPVEGVDYNEMSVPVVRWFYSPDQKELVPDMSMFSEMRRTVDRLYRKSERMATR